MKLRQLFEAPQRHVTVGVCYGRWNPPHKGHRAAWETAAQFGDFYVGTNQNTAGPDDPLPYDVKLKAMAAIWPEVSGHVIPETNLFTLVTKIFGKYGEGVDLKVATDEAWLVNSLLKYNGIEAAHGYYKFNSIAHVPTPRLSSATALRAAVRAGDREAFAEAAGVSADTPVHVGKKSVPFFDLVAHYLTQYPEKAKKAKKDVAEGSEQVYKVVAVNKSNALKKPTKLTVKAGSIEEVFERLAVNDWYPLEINGVEVINGKRLKQGVVEGSGEAEAYKAHLIKTMPQMMNFLSKKVKGWTPGEEEMLGAIDTAYMVMKHTGDVKQAGKALMDELNTLHRMSQGKQGVAEGESTTQKYEMMMRNGQVKKFMAKDDADAKRIAAGHNAKSVIKLRGGVPAGKVSEQGVAEIFSNDKETGTTHKGGAVTKTAHGIKHTKTDYDDGHGERGRKSTGRESRYKQTPILDKDYDVAEGKEDKGITAIVNSMLKGVPSSVAEGIRSAVASSTDKLAALKNGLEKHQSAMEDGILAEDGTNQYGNIYQLDRIMLEAGMKKMNKKHSAAIRNAITFPDQNSSSGSSYLNYRIGVAMAGAPNFDTPADNFIGGDPLFAPYTKEELDKVNFAAKQVGSKGKQVWSDSGSNEVADTNKTSTVAKTKRNQYGV